MKKLMVVVAVAALFDVALATGSDDKWWPDYGANAASSHFVDLDQINKSNVGQLEVAWFYPYGQTGFNPIIIDGMMYVLGRNNSLIALDATTGKEIWIHERLNGITSRGINYWRSPEGKQRRLIFAINGYMQAIDAQSGESIRTFGDGGIVDLRRGLARAEGTDKRVQSRTPGKIWKNLLIMGSAPGEAWITPPGDIRAYDVVTGKLAWQFHTVPLPGEFGYDTWPKDAFKYVGGANNWGEMSIDEERGIVYIPTGSATYDFYGADRIGTNLFANCLLALDARTGKRLWHYQTVHHDLWDLDNVSAPQLVTARPNGTRVDAVALAGKTGFLYVFNRVTGAPLWPIEERAVPKSDVPGEQSWPTQPIPTKPPAFAKLTFTVDDVNPWLLTPEEYERTRERVTHARNEGIYTPPTLGDTISMPGNQGGSNWGTTASDPGKGLVFVVNVNEVAILKLEDVKTRAGRPGALGQQVYQLNCQMCHGANQPNAPEGVAPSLADITARMSEDAIRAIVTGGTGTMRPLSHLTDADITAVINYLGSTNPDNGPNRGNLSFGPAPPPGPVVASGGVPIPKLPISLTTTPTYGGIGGTGGNTPWPDDVAMPPNRFVTEYGVMASATKPPYTTLTAYDLNAGAIKWQVPIGDDLQTLARGGPANTGGLGARNGMVVTKSGLVFVAGGDGKARAYDEETGQVLWSGALPGNSSGIPASYQANGRQYVIFSSVPRRPARSGRGGRGDERGGLGDEPAGRGDQSLAAPAIPEIAPDAPRGYIAFALPVREKTTQGIKH